MGQLRVQLLKLIVPSADPLLHPTHPRIKNNSVHGCVKNAKRILTSCCHNVTYFLRKRVKCTHKVGPTFVHTIVKSFRKRHAKKSRWRFSNQSIDDMTKPKLLPVIVCNFLKPCQHVIKNRAHNLFTNCEQRHLLVSLDAPGKPRFAHLQFLLTVNCYSILPFYK